MKTRSKKNIHILGLYQDAIGNVRSANEAAEIYTNTTGESISTKYIREIWRKEKFVSNHVLGGHRHGISKPQFFSSVYENKQDFKKMMVDLEKTSSELERLCKRNRVELINGPITNSDRNSRYSVVKYRIRSRGTGSRKEGNGH